MLILHFLVSQFNELYFFLLNRKLHFVCLWVVCTKMISCLQYHRRNKFLDSFTLSLSLSCRALSFDKSHELLHAKFEVSEWFNLALSKAYLNRFELLLQKLTYNRMCLPNVFLLEWLFYLLKFFFERCSEHFDVLTKNFLVEMSQGCLLGNFEALKNCFIVTRKFDILIETRFENLQRFFCGLLTLVLTNISPSTLDIWNCSSVDWVDILLRQIHKNPASQ